VAGTLVAAAAHTKACDAQVLEDAQLQRLDIDRVLLVGGSTRIPAIRAILQEYFGNRVELNQEVRTIHRLGTLHNAHAVPFNEHHLWQALQCECCEGINPAAVHQSAMWWTAHPMASHGPASSTDRENTRILHA
jgi:Hsp70 protein